MKLLKYTVCTLLLLTAGACSSDETDKTGQIRREALLATDAVGIYCKGEVQIEFDKSTQQLYVDPAKKVFRMQDDRGEKYLEVTLSGMPSANAGVSGTIRGNLGMQPVELNNLVLLRNAGGCMWLWTDDGQWGLVLPWPGN